MPRFDFIEVVENKEQKREEKKYDAVMDFNRNREYNTIMNVMTKEKICVFIHLHFMAFISIFLSDVCFFAMTLHKNIIYFSVNIFQPFKRCHFNKMIIIWYFDAAAATDE